VASSRLFVSLASALAVAASACAPGLQPSVELDGHLCAPETLGEDYQELIRGVFSPRDLADLSEDADARESEYRAAGMESGKFVYFKSVLPKPPFEPPVNVVCQAIEFEDATGAERYLASLDAADAHNALAFGAVPGEDVVTESRPSPLAGPPDLRYFAAAGGTGEQRTTVSFLVGAEGRFVRLVAVGSRARLTEQPDDLLVSLWLNRGRP